MLPLKAPDSDAEKDACIVLEEGEWDASMMEMGTWEGECSICMST